VRGHISRVVEAGCVVTSGPRVVRSRQGEQTAQTPSGRCAIGESTTPRRIPGSLAPLARRSLRSRTWSFVDSSSGASGRQCRSRRAVLAAGLVHCGSQGKATFQRRESVRCRCSLMRTWVRFQIRAATKRVAALGGYAAPAARARATNSNHKRRAASLSRGRRSWWRRWELNPGPQGVRSTFIHARSR
jgi:hypothetical protein